MPNGLAVAGKMFLMAPVYAASCVACCTLTTERIVAIKLNATREALLGLGGGLSWHFRW